MKKLILISIVMIIILILGYFSFRLQQWMIFNL